MKETLVGIATIIAIIGYAPYFHNIARGLTKPHSFSWLVWTALTGIGFAAQIAEHGGPGAWVTGFTALISFFVFIASLFRGEREITRSDWVCLIGAACAGAAWFITDGPLLSVLLITVVDFLGFFPTFRKSFHKPYEETLFTYAISAVKFAISLFALSTLNITTVLYPLSLVLANGAFCAMVLIRRHSYRF